MAPNVNLQRMKLQRDIEKLRKDLLKQEKQQKKQQEEEQKKQQEEEQKKQQERKRKKHALIKYSETSLLIDGEFHIDKDVPIIIKGDFNVDFKRNEKAFGFMKKHFDLNMVPTNYPSTLGNSYIDLTFARNISNELLNSVDYILFISSTNPAHNCNISTHD
ncbi:hypothetical protein AVEN_264204-1 [Araneus ventricosus]|uniref:Endonuclease/exonuclease/phosphatase domain-containing protein n=1 Tax=Araneus ventricosus TaxID=182803 RepID=A0A4Y2MLC7_ARAVE|nr:hypothetical protein AVEN_264204-1 [Araneus ventricosus]